MTTALSTQLSTTTFGHLNVKAVSTQAFCIDGQFKFSEYPVFSLSFSSTGKGQFLTGIFLKRLIVL